MSDNVVAFPDSRTLRQPIAHFPRPCDGRQHKLVGLRASGDWPFQRVLGDAFQADGAGIVPAEHFVNGPVAGAARLADRTRGPEALQATSEQHGVDPASLARRDVA